MVTKEDRELIKKAIREVPDFPKPGIQFKDITTLLLNPVAFNKCLTGLADYLRDKQIDLIAGIEARGFVLGSPLAVMLNKGFVMLRKPNKLPGAKISVEYGLEYGKDRLELHTDAIQPGQRVAVIDDLIATGGTCVAGCKLIEQAGGVVVGCVFVIELRNLGGRKVLEDAGRTAFSLLDYYDVE